LIAPRSAGGPVLRLGPQGPGSPWRPFVLDVGGIAENGAPPDDPSHLMVRDIRGKLIEAT